jgi:CHAT domain-containing protein
MRVTLLFLAIGAMPSVHAQQPAPSTAGWIVTYPERARDSIRLWLVTATADSSNTAALFAQAERLGIAYLRAWEDSFPLLEVRRFANWSPDERARRLRVDSLRRAGNAALGQSGVDDALRNWRASFQLARELRDTAAMAAALGNIGAGFYRSGELDSAQHYFSRARGMARLAGDWRTMLNALGGLASVNKDQGDLRTATTQYTEALALRRRIGDYRGVAADANNLGLVAAALGDETEARRRHTEALVTAREHGLDEPAAAALVNLGALASENGDYDVAERHYAAALALYRKLNDPADEALVLRNLGLVDAGRGSYRRAALRYQASLALLARTGPPQSVVSVRLDLANVFAAMGSLDKSERELARAEMHARQNDLSLATQGRLRLTRGDLALQFNQLKLAREAYTAALSLLRRARDVAGEADALAALGALSLTEEDPRRARELLVSAALRHQSLGDSRSAALSRILVAQAMHQLGDTAGARQVMTDAGDTLRASGDRVAEAWALCKAGDLRRTDGLPLAAEAAYRSGLERLGRRPVPEVATCLFGGLGAALRARDAGHASVIELQRGVSAIEVVAGQVGTLRRRNDFLTDKWTLYTDLALAQRAVGNDSAAFGTSERLRARQTLALLAKEPVNATAAVEDPQAVALRRRITALMTIAATRETTVPLRGDDALDRLPNRQREALAQAQDAYARLIDSLEGARSSNTSVRPSDVPGWRDIAARLPANGAFIEYLITDSAAIAFLITAERLSVVDLPVTGAELATGVDFARGTLVPRRSVSGAAWRAPLGRLHAQLVAPIEATGQLRDKSRLIIVPHGELHYLPFAALVESGPSGRFLIERYEIGYVSSAAVWLTLMARESGPRAGRVLALAPRTRDLAGTKQEVAAIAGLYGKDATVITDERATRRAFMEAAPRHSIIHLATLGVLNKHNPLFSFVELAPSGDSDGRLEVHDVFSLRLTASLVVLSACQTALGSGRVADVPAGDDWVGLVQAFQTAGAGKVLATLWPVDDQVTAQLMRRFYSELRSGSSEATALAIAQRSALRGRGSASPFYWAGFVLDGGI